MANERKWKRVEINNNQYNVREEFCYDDKSVEDLIALFQKFKSDVEADGYKDLKIEIGAETDYYNEGAELYMKCHAKQQETQEEADKRVATSERKSIAAKKAAKKKAANEIEKKKALFKKLKEEGYGDE